MADNIRLIVGIGFSFLLVVFLAIAFFVDTKENQSRWAILRFACSLCAGAAGAFLTGEAIFRASGKTTGGAEYFIGGTAGVALFFTVWFQFGKFVSPTPPPAPPSVSFRVPVGATFSQAARGLVQASGSVVQFVGFNDAELATLLTPQQIDVETLSDALQVLGDLSAGQPIRKYGVSFTKPTYTLTVNV